MRINVRNISLSKREAFLKVYFRSEAGDGVTCSGVTLFHDILDFTCTKNCVSSSALQMDVMVCTSE